MLSKSIMRFNRSKLAASRMFASSDYQTLDDHLFYVPAHPVLFTDKLAIFDNIKSTERRYSPWELKEITFKNTMGFAGTVVLDHMWSFGALTQIACAGWCLNWAHSSFTLLRQTVRLVELHKDGRHVTLHPRVGSAFTVKISAIEKQRHEKTLVETYEESFLFPINVQGRG